RLGAALETYRQALEIAARSGRAARPTAGIAHVGLAEVAYQQGELEVARGHLAEGIPLCRQLIYPQPLAAGLSVLAWIRQAGDDHAGALEAMEEAERAGPVPGVTSLLNPVPAQRARLLLAQGDIAAAAAWTEERGLEAGDRPSYAREPEYLVLARVLLARGRPDQARALLERMHARAVAQQRTGSRIELQALHALALAFVLACPERYVRLFADEGAPMAALTGRLVAAQRTRPTAAGRIPLAYLGQVARAFGPDLAAAGPDGRAGTAVAAGLVVPLSDRELEVLRL